MNRRVFEKNEQGYTYTLPTGQTVTITEAERQRRYKLAVKTERRRMAANVVIGGFVITFLLFIFLTAALLIYVR